MTATPLEQPATPAHMTAEAEVAALILGAVERASAGIMAAAVEAAKAIAEAAQAVPTALSTPPAITNQVSPEVIAEIIERYQPDYGGPDLDVDLRVDNYEDQYGNRIAPDWQPPGGDEAVMVPDPTRDTSDTIVPGSVLVPGVPRLDLP